MHHLDYLVRHGLTGDLGRYRGDEPLSLARGASVVVRGIRGLELGEVARPAPSRLGLPTPEIEIGRLIRPANAADLIRARECADRASALLARGSALAESLGLGVSLLDARVLLDGEKGEIQFLRWGKGDVRDLVRALSAEFTLLLTLTDLTASSQEDAKASGGCGSCGSSGGCGSCGSSGAGGGCGSGCGTVRPAEVQAYFADLRKKMERRVPLL